MEIKLESNRKFVFKYLISSIILFTAIIIGLIIYCIFDKATFMSLFGIALSTIIDVIYIFVLIVICKKRKPQYMFNIDKIIYTKRDKEYEIKVSNIKSMTYMRMKWYEWVLALFFALLGDAGAFAFPVIKVVEKDEKEHELGFFSKKEVERLKSFYDSILEIK